jgi:pimeloyl-ACP methyl ester carboxylesterase
MKKRKTMAHIKTYLIVLITGILILGIVAVVNRYLHEISAAREQVNRLGSVVIDTKCGPIEYARVGDGYPVLVVHGDMGGFDQGLLAAKPVLDAGFQVIAVSRFGYLRSPLPEQASVDRQVDAYACLLDALGIQKAAVFAFSAGATSAIRFAARYPERISALILQCPAAPGKVKVASPPRAIFDTIMRSDLAFWALITYNKPFAYKIIGVPDEFNMRPEFQAEANAILASTLPLSERIDGFLFDTYDPQLEKEFYQETSEISPYPLRQIKTPALVINAEDDPYANIENVRGLAEKLPDARLFVLPDGGHPLFGHAQEIQVEIKQFLNNTAFEPVTSR